jgi:hypothetical protein
MARVRIATSTSALTCAFVAALMVSAATGNAQRSETEGIKETESFVKAGSETSAAVGEAKLRVQNTLGAYNNLVTQPSKDMKGDYKKLLKAVKEMNDKASAARQQVAEMEGSGATYFTGRAATIKNIQNDDLRAQAQQRLAKSQEGFGAVLKALQQVGQSLEPVRKDLADQINYLGSDLTPGATASLKPQAEKLNERGTVAFTAADQAISKANEYFNSMRPAKS